MATYKFKCSSCGKSVSARSYYYKIYLGKYDCENVKELSNHYVCWACRKKRGERVKNREILQLELQDYPKYSEIKGYINLEAKKLNTVGLNDERAKNIFLENVKLVLASEGITQYNFVIEQNVLTSIQLKLPFIGIINMPININKGE